MATGTTPVQGWPFPLETDTPDVAADVHSLALALDIVPKRLSGLASARPVASSTPVGTGYLATDTGEYTICTGSAWLGFTASTRKLTLQASGGAIGNQAAGDWVFLPSGAMVTSGGSSGQAGVAIWPGDSGLSSQPQDFQVPGRTAYGRIRGSLAPNATSAGVTVTFGLYQITGSGGATGSISYTFGSALAGSTVAIAAAGSIAAGESGQFALPSTGFWALGINLSGIVPAAAVISLTTQLYSYNAA